jgi:hypothetical protein
MDWSMTTQELKQRTFEFGTRVVPAVEALPKLQNCENTWATVAARWHLGRRKLSRSSAREITRGFHSKTRHRRGRGR